MTKQLKDKSQSKVSHKENHQVLGLFMIILVKRTLKLLHTVTHSTILKNVIVKCYKQKTPTEECLKCGQSIDTKMSRTEEKAIKHLWSTCITPWTMDKRTALLTPTKRLELLTSTRRLPKARSKQMMRHLAANSAAQK